MLNISLKIFKSQYLRKKNQILYSSIKTDGIKEIENLDWDNGFYRRDIGYKIIDI